MVGAIMLQNWTGPLPAVLNGHAALWEMSAATQAAVIPALLTCGLPAQESANQTTIALGFGGQATAMPPNSSALYTRGR